MARYNSTSTTARKNMWGHESKFPAKPIHPRGSLFYNTKVYMHIYNYRIASHRMALRSPSVLELWTPCVHPYGQGMKFPSVFPPGGAHVPQRVGGGGRNPPGLFQSCKRPPSYLVLGSTKIWIILFLRILTQVWFKFCFINCRMTCQSAP